MDIGAKDIDKQVKFALDNKIDYAWLLPMTTCAGAVDALEAAGIPCFGLIRRRLL